MGSVTVTLRDGGGAGAVKLKVSTVPSEAVTVPEDETASVPGPEPSPPDPPDPAAGMAGQARAAAPTAATATPPAPAHVRDRRMPTPRRTSHVPIPRRGRSDR